MKTQKNAPSPTFQVVKADLLEHLQKEPRDEKSSRSEFLATRKARIPKLQSSHCQTWNSLPGTITFCSCLAPCCLATTVAYGEVTGEKSPFQSGAGVGVIRSKNCLLTSQKREKYIVILRGGQNQAASGGSDLNVHIIFNYQNQYLNRII